MEVIEVTVQEIPVSKGLDAFWAVIVPVRLKYNVITL